MKTVIKKKGSQLPSIKIYFADNGQLRKQIEEDAKKFGVSMSIMASMYIKAGRPLVVKTFEKMNKKAHDLAA